MRIPEHVGQVGERRVLAHDVARGRPSDVSHGTVEGWQYPVGVVHVLGGDGRTRVPMPEQTAHTGWAASGTDPLPDVGHRVSHEVEQPVNRTGQNRVGTARWSDVRGHVPPDGDELAGVGVLVGVAVSGASPGVRVLGLSFERTRSLSTEDRSLARVENGPDRSASGQACPFEDSRLQPMTSFHIVQVAILMLHVGKGAVRHLRHGGHDGGEVPLDQTEQTARGTDHLLRRGAGHLIAEVGDRLGLSPDIATARSHRHNRTRVLLEFGGGLGSGRDVGRQIGLWHSTH